MLKITTIVKIILIILKNYIKTKNGTNLGNYIYIEQRDSKKILGCVCYSLLSIYSYVINWQSKKVTRGKKVSNVRNSRDISRIKGRQIMDS